MSKAGRTAAVFKIAMAFGVMAFCVALASAVVANVDFMVALYRAILAGAAFVAFGGVLTLLLTMFLSED